MGTAADSLIRQPAGPPPSPHASAHARNKSAAPSAAPDPRNKDDRPAPAHHDREKYAPAAPGRQKKGNPPGLGGFRFSFDADKFTNFWTALLNPPVDPA